MKPENEKGRVAKRGPKGIPDNAKIIAQNRGGVNSALAGKGNLCASWIFPRD